MSVDHSNIDESPRSTNELFYQVIAFIRDERSKQGLYIEVNGASSCSLSFLLISLRLHISCSI